MERKNNIDCNVEDCKNKSWQGVFKGNLCIPCYEYCKEIYEGKNKASQVYRNHYEECKIYLKQCEIYEITEKYT